MQEQREACDLEGRQSVLQKAERVEASRQAAKRGVRDCG